MRYAALIGALVIGLLFVAACRGVESTPTATTTQDLPGPGAQVQQVPPPTATAVPRDQVTSLGVELVAIDSHWDNNGIALWWEGIDIEVSHWIVERSTDADGPWEVVTIRTPSELLPEDDPLKYARVWDSKLPPGHHYYYRLFACTNEGRTGYSNVVEATVPDFMPGLVPPIKEE